MTAATRHEIVTGKGARRPRFGTHAFLIAISALWIFPLAWAVYTSFRPYGETARLGYVSVGGAYNIDNFARAWDEINGYYFNTLVIVVPALILILFFASMIAFAVSRYSFRFNMAMLMIFTAGNLLPQQIIIQPLFQFYNRVELPSWLSNSGKLNGSTWGLILIHVAFQSGFCTFVLSNYMKLLPKSLNEAARVDGAGVWKQYWQIIMPLTLPAIAALATLEFTWIYNDFFWAVVLEQQGADRPITSSLANLGGEFFTDDNLIAAASMYVALPTLIVYFALQRYFISGLTIGAEKG